MELNQPRVEYSADEHILNLSTRWIAAISQAYVSVPEVLRHARVDAMTSRFLYLEKQKKEEDLKLLEDDTPAEAPELEAEASKVAQETQKDDQTHGLKAGATPRKPQESAPKKLERKNPKQLL